MFLHIGRGWISHCVPGEMSDARLPGGLPHLPVCGVCVQPGGSHGPDSLSHHPDQVFFSLHPWIRLGFSKSPTHYSHLCFSFRTVSPELKSYALGVLFLLLRLLGKNFFHQITHLYFIAQVWIMQHKTVTGVAETRFGDYITYLVLNAACTYGEKVLSIRYLRNSWHPDGYCTIVPQGTSST